MVKDKKIGELLGIKQEYIAMLLQVTRSKWSMYALGKRDLPVAAKLKLAEMLTFVNQLDTDGNDRIAPTNKQKVKTKKFLEEQQIINKHKQNVVGSKLNSYKEKYEAAIIALQLIDFLASKSQEEAKHNDMLLQLIKSNAETAIERNGLDIQEQYALKLQVLQYEESLLKEKLLTPLSFQSFIF